MRNRTTKYLVVLALVLTALASWTALPNYLRKLAPNQTAQASRLTQPLIHRAAKRESVTSPAVARSNPSVKLREGEALLTAYAGAANFRHALAQNTAQPLALASGDFDEDGVADLVSGYAGAGRGLLTLHRGNVDALFPNSPEAQQRKAGGQFTDSPFLSPAQVRDVPEAPEFIATGDFNADGHWDIVTAARGSATLYLLPGDGRGGFAVAQPIELPGGVTAMASGEINQADGLIDLAVGIVGAAGPQALVFESPDGALRGLPEVFALPSEATALAIGRLDDDPMNDLAVAAGQRLAMIKGRDRRLSLDEARRAEVEPAAISERVLPSAITDLAIGDFIGAQRSKLALMLDDGTVQMLGPDSAEAAETSRSGFGQWPAREVLRVSRTRGSHAGARFVCARVSTNPGEDLVVADSDRLRIVAGGAEIRAAALEGGGEPAAMLPMQLNADALHDLVMLGSGRSAPTLTLTAPEAIFNVTNTNDSGSGSLRNAITQANLTAAADTINFSIGGGLQTINLTSPLPAITQTVAINGATQPGFSGAPLIVLNGSGAGITANGLVINAANCAIRSLVINGFGHVGVVMSGAGATGNIVQGCYIGTNAAGTAAVPNGTDPNSFDIDGVDIVNGANNNTIGGTSAGARNVISGNKGDGVFIFEPGANNNLVQGNYIGTDAAGTFAIGNGFAPFGNAFGVELATGSSPGPQGNIIGGTAAGAGNLVSGNAGAGVGIFNADTNNNLVQGNFVGTNADGTSAIQNGFRGVQIANPPTGPTPGPISAKNNLIGGTTPSARNVISGNSISGVYIANQGTNNNLVQGNYIGTNAAGTAAVPNTTQGVEVAAFAQSNTIGGTAAGARNVLSGNTLSGVEISASNNFVQGNFIGTDAAGTAAIPNMFFGVFIFGGQTNTVGGTTAGAGNLISGNTFFGVLINNPSASSNQVQGNFIGTQADGTSPLGNGSDGVRIGFDAGTNNTIGGLTGGAGNTIAFNGGAGILAITGSDNPFRRNSIFSNGGLGIDLLPTDVTPNDSCDGDSGPNNLQNFPVLTVAAGTPGGTTIQGTLESAASTTFTLEFFANPACDASGNGEGKTFVGSASVTTAGNCMASFNVTIPTSVPGGQFLTATATDPAGNTSEFSACIQVCFFSISPTGQTFTASGGSDSVNVTALSGCSWTAVSNDSFITITSGASGTGNGTVNYSVAVNPSAAPRIGTMTIAGQTFTVIQSGVTCAGLISPTSASYSVVGGTGSVAVPAPGGCSWTAVSNVAWITITSGSSGSGNGTVNYSVDVNAGAQRTGTVTIAGQIFTVTQAGSNGGLMYYPLAFPVRVLDTRPDPFTSCVPSSTPLVGGGTLTLPVAGNCNGLTIPATAKAVVGNATVVNFQSSGGFITLFPSDAPLPNASNLNFVANHIVPNSFTVGLGGDGAIKIFTSASTNFIVDITGYYAPPGTGGLYFHPLAFPVRMLDTRPDPFPSCVPSSTPLVGGGTLTLSMVSPCNGLTIPASAKAILGNATVVNFQSGGGFMTLFPSDATLPNASNLNFTASHIVPNSFVVGLSATGSFNIFTSASTNFIVDITGYFSDQAMDVNGQGLFFNALSAPARWLDTRPDPPFVSCIPASTPFADNSIFTLQAQMTCEGQVVPASAKSVLGNATVVNFQSGGGFITLFPSDAMLPNASNLNFTANHIVPNSFVVGLGGTGAFKIFTSAATNFIIDLSGYFAP